MYFCHFVSVCHFAVFVRYKIIICLHNHIVVENLLSFDSCLALRHALHLKEEAPEALISSWPTPGSEFTSLLDSKEDTDVNSAL